jgi:siderophore synthetase component
MRPLQIGENFLGYLLERRMLCNGMLNNGTLAHSWLANVIAQQIYLKQACLLVYGDAAKAGFDGCQSGGSHRVMLNERAEYANVKKPQES